MLSQLDPEEKVLKRGLTEEEKKEHIGSGAEVAQTNRTNLSLPDTYRIDYLKRSYRTKVMWQNSICIKIFIVTN